MINYITYVMDQIKEVAVINNKRVPVTVTYPDTDIVPIVIVKESDQTEIFICSQYEHASSTVVVEVYTTDIATRNKLRDNIDMRMRSLNYELIKKEDIDNNTIYKSALTYECELIDRNGDVTFYRIKK